MYEEKPPLNPQPLSPYVAWAGKRNRDAIYNVLKEKLPKTNAHVLEIGSGSGMHIIYFAPHFEHLHFHPSDFDESVFKNINSLKQEKGVNNVEEPIKLDLLSPETWPKPEEQLFEVIIAINILHVASFQVAEGMMQCAGKLLKPGGFLYLYGPFKVNGEYSSPSNQEFDKTLKSFGVTQWSLKDVADLAKAAQNHGLTFQEKIEMPSHNFSVLFAKLC
ncbi:MAG: DUF938 domain-containing protein [Symploca sp. SIO1C4]|uniref:DUF938 domain-containing protein n=1 Tax=Symploca sp. SIO1C4 TaxID=2607765 RepID=A0A6B3NA95_9CYAN|nr:DUF938 domain-containing protein [Symploca sp. SIO1C4]NET06209.1 DUF938 domain-containing protein [Symploca sp. SIO2B6]NET49904.1 DUF938 domain-containing protein [Merismopedia sp. SIO2A8]